MINYRPVFDWLVDGAPGAKNPAEVVQRMSDDLVTAGLPLSRVEAFVRTLHPEVVGRSFLWTPGNPMVVRENSYAFLHSPEFLLRPASRVFETGRPVRVNLRNEDFRKEFSELGEFAAEGHTDFLAGPLAFINGEVHAITCCTKAPDGFTAEQIAGMLDILRPLSRVGEIYARTRTAANLLNTYVGRNAGERILAGKIQRGDTESLNAVIWFSDLRGFTSLTAELTPGEIIRVLNDLFDCQVPAIGDHGGEVLKFIGDGLLAIFPLEGTGRSPRETCDEALLAAEQAFGILDRLNRLRTEHGTRRIEFGLALHPGQISYGNIGGMGRLDFTCIGPAVNLAARLEGLTSRLERRLVLSAEFARQTGRPVRRLGAFELKGVQGLQEVFAPDAQ